MRVAIVENTDMPQPYRLPATGGNFWKGWTALNNRPQCAALIGLIATQWSSLESDLDGLALMAASSTVKHDTEYDAFQLDGSLVVAVAMKEIESLAVRLNVIIAIIKEQGGAPLIPECKALADRIRKTAGERALVVHTQWVSVDAYPNDVIRTIGEDRGYENHPHRVRKYCRYTPNDFKAILGRILDRQHELRVFGFNLRAYRAGVSPPQIARIPTHEPPTLG